MTDALPIPGVRGIDHIGLTVPDLDEAEAFFCDVLGATRVYTLGGKRDDDGDWMMRTLGVHPRTVISEIRFLRLAHGPNLELFNYVPADGQGPMPRNSDIGGHHLALYVDDMDAAVAGLARHGIAPMGEAVRSAGAAEGQRWLYFRAPWGLQCELVSYPAGKAYEATSDVLLWHPAHPER
jgi:glyoxylase I family protein